jgi:hypothetical protein
MDLIPASDAQLKTWLVDLAGNIAVSDADVAMLDAQITHLENQCSALHRSDQPAGDSCNIAISQPRPIPE